MKGRFVSGAEIVRYLCSMLNEGNHLTAEARIERINTLLHFSLISWDVYQNMVNEINSKFSDCPMS